MGGVMPKPQSSAGLTVGAAHEDPYYIRTTSSVTGERDLVLKQDESFLFLNRHGDIRPVGFSEAGLYHEGTRHLSRMTLRLGGRPAQLLSSAVQPDNARITVNLTNVDLGDGVSPPVPRGALHVSRSIVLWKASLYEHLEIRNYERSPVRATLQFDFEADFADIFEVRGTARKHRGQRLPPECANGQIVLGYRGLDDVVRRTTIVVEPRPTVLLASEARLELAIEPGGLQTCEICVTCDVAQQRPGRVGYTAAVAGAADRLSDWRGESCEITTSSHQFNMWLKRSLADLSMMMTETPHGPFPYAGVPWFSTPFGRDSLITALECLWNAPRLARAVLGYLAATQATTEDSWRDAQPGKILHEARAGEMAAVGEIPFGRYYGSHDATPLFVVLAAAYYHRTGDRPFIEHIWPNIDAALRWISRWGDVDGDGFIEYQQQSPVGLVHQGWKDSHDSVFYADGRDVQGPVALCEIQGYVYAAWRGAAELAPLVGRASQANTFNERAEKLRRDFEEAFWCPALRTYALALDGQKRRCEVVSSNPGHTLLTGLPSDARARQIADTLLAPENFSGWGIRTLAMGEIRYNPMSYHNGSIWPHDNALIARGLARYGLREHVLTVMRGMFEASSAIDLHRLPELFCGFPRRSGEDPVPYPVACNPQAWASASVFMLLGACLGLDVSARERLVRFTRAKLPAFLDEVHIRNLQVGSETLDFVLERHEDDVGVNVLRRGADVEIVAIK
jgi:glycogen debranching enzyme